MSGRCGFYSLSVQSLGTDEKFKRFSVSVTTLLAFYDY